MDASEVKSAVCEWLPIAKARGSVPCMSESPAASLRAAVSPQYQTSVRTRGAT